MRFGRLFPVLLLLLLASCTEKAPRTPAIGEMFAGPAALPLRKDLAPKSQVIASAKHGDRLEVLEYKRRFVRVRTAEGREGWTDTHLLLTPEQMADLRTMAQKSATLPSQGLATVFEALNMHADASRSSPSFVQIPENAKVDVLVHKLTPRTQAAPTSAPVVKVTRPLPRRRSKEKAAGKGLAPPPLPAPPKVPSNWLRLSVPSQRMAALEPDHSVAAGNQPAKPPVPVAMDDWSLVRTKDGRAGWVLTRMLSMAIPDDVAQYAEGHRITSYFSLAEVHDGDNVKNDWLWTTITKGSEPYEFDSFRVFVWSRNHHRYETAYIERRLEGHQPVTVDKSGPDPKFSVLLTGGDGNLYRKTFVLEGNRVRFLERTRADQPSPEQTKTPTSVASSQDPGKAQPGGSWFSQLKHGFTRLFR